jgi:HAD superfamily hydrolase (TIGR01509 family)
MPADALAAVLFDMDGLLVDSEPGWQAVEGALFEELGGGRPWTPADAQQLVGHPIAVSAGILGQLAGSDVPAADLAERLVADMVAWLRADVPWKPGALDLLAALTDAGVPTGLVSSSYRRLVDTVLEAAPAGTFAVSVAGDEVRRAKPHPEPYERALGRLGVVAAATVVLEDSPVGATAAAAAGCRVVVVPDVAVLPEQHPWAIAPALTALDVPALRRLVTAG